MYCSNTVIYVDLTEKSKRTANIIYLKCIPTAVNYVMYIELFVED